MKPKNLFRIFVLLAVIFSTVGIVQSVQAGPDFQDPNPEVVIREFTFWDGTFYGEVSDVRYEKWPLVFTETHSFSVTVTPTSGDLVPLVLLLDHAGVELTRGTGSFTSTQPAGTYYIQVQPESGAGTYELRVRKVDDPGSNEPYVSTEIPVDNLTVGESTTVTVKLNNVPPEGYTSAEFTCTYPPTLVEASNVIITDLFGTDPATAGQDPLGGSFIIAIAGSNGQRATTSGAVFTFDIGTLLVGQATIECTARVSTGDGTLIDLPSTPAVLTINELILNGTLEGQVLASKPVTIDLYNPDDTLAASMVANGDGTFSMEAIAGTYTVAASASGFLGAQGPAVIMAGETTTKATISLLAGDIDGNGVIDQYDAMTIGMSYNTATPDAADLNADGIINILDLELLAANYRASGLLDWQ